MKMYYYPNCSSCKAALSFIKTNRLEVSTIDISKQAPSIDELQTMLDHYDGAIKKLFNTSGKLYKELNLKDKISTISIDEAFQILSKNGMLVKRPFLISKKIGLLGFKLEEWSKLL